MKRAERLSLAFAAILPFALHGDFWVAATGNDGAMGSLEQPFATIQHAVDVAPAGGCNIYVSEGLYVADGSPTYLLNIDKPVKVIALGDREKTILDAERKRKNTFINHEDALLKGFTIRNGYVNKNSGNGLYLQSGTVRDCIIENNEGNGGCGVYQKSGLLDSSIVRNNTAVGNATGLGIRLEGGTVSSCEIYGNYGPRSYAASGAGIFAQNSSVVTNCHIHHNGYGSVSYTYQDQVPYSNGGGVYLSGTATVIDSVIANNFTQGEGGGVFFEKGGRLFNSIVFGNCTSNIYYRESGAVQIKDGIISNCIITANSAVKGVQGLYQNGGRVYNTVVFGNGLYDYCRAKGFSDGLYTNNIAFKDAENGDFRLVDGCINKKIGLLSWSMGDDLSCTFSSDKRVVSSSSPEAITFCATGNNAEGTPSFSWNMGDGTFLDGETVAHTFSKPGFYSISLTVTDGATSVTTEVKDFILVRPEVVHLTAGAPTVEIDESKEMVLSSIYTALKYQPETIFVYEGTYEIPLCPIVLSSPIKIIGYGDREKIIFDAKNTKPSRCAVLDNDEALLSGVTLTRATLDDDWQQGAGAYLMAGTVSNCVIKSNRSMIQTAFKQTGGILADCLIKQNVGTKKCNGIFGAINGGLFVGNTMTSPGTFNSQSTGNILVDGENSVVSNCCFYGNNLAPANGMFSGGAIYLANGLVANCVITNNAANYKGGGILLGGGTVRNCLIADNTATDAANGFGGGIYQNGGSVENCTITGNSSGDAGGIFSADGTIVNTIVYGNENGDIGGTPSEVTYSCAPGLTGETNFDCDPRFLTIKGWPYTISGKSSLVNKGLLLSWMAGAKDLAGNPRLRSIRPSIGAYEVAYLGRTMLMLK